MRCVWKGESSSFKGKILLECFDQALYSKKEESPYQKIKPKVLKGPTFTALAGVSNSIQIPYPGNFLSLLCLKILLLLRETSFLKKMQKRSFLTCNQNHYAHTNIFGLFLFSNRTPFVFVDVDIVQDRRAKHPVLRHRSINRNVVID